MAFALLCTALAIPASAHAAPTVENTGWTTSTSLAKSGPLTSPTFSSAERGFAIVGSRLIRTNLGGRSWSVMVVAEWAHAYPNAISFGDPTHGWAVSDAGLILATTDGGSRWITQTVTPACAGRLTAVQALDAAHVWALGDDGSVLRTRDGVNWAAEYPFPGATLCGLAFEDSYHGWVVGADAAGRSLILATQDGGATWTQQLTPAVGSLKACAVAGPGRLVAAAGTGAIFTVDHGTSWQLSTIEMPVSQRVSLAFADASRGYLGIEEHGAGSPCLWETTDGGATFTPLYDSLENNGIWGLTSAEGRVIATGHTVVDGAYLGTSKVWMYNDPGISAKPAIWTPLAPASARAGRLSIAGRLGVRRNPRSFKVKLVCQRLVGRKWKAAGSYTARLDASGGSYSSQISLPRTGCWRVRAVHGSGKRAVYSGYAYVRVVARTR